MRGPSIVAEVSDHHLHRVHRGRAHRVRIACRRDQGRGRRTALRAGEADASTVPSRGRQIRAVRRFVADPASCAALGARVHVATVYEVQPGFFGTQAVCWREVRTGDSAFGSAVHIAVYVPRVRSHEGWTFASPSTSGTGTIATCIAHGQRTRVPVVALTTSDRAAGRCLVPLDTSSTDSSEDSSVSNLQFAVVLPAEDVR